MAGASPGRRSRAGSNSSRSSSSSTIVPAVEVPSFSSRRLVSGATADKLLILGKVGCSGTTSMLTYDPAANTSTVLLGPPINGGGVSDARLFPGQE